MRTQQILALLVLAFSACAFNVQKQRFSADFLRKNGQHWTSRAQGAPSTLKQIALLLLGANPSATFNPTSVGISVSAGTSRMPCSPVMLEMTKWQEPPPRLRFAPSPTGVLHVGGARTALFNWLWARHHEGGKFILRLEDTDTERSTKESEEEIISGLKWCGLHWDEGPDVGGDCGPYRQSDAIKEGIYQEALEKLMKAGHVYRCFLTEEDLDEMAAKAEAENRSMEVRSPWRTASEEEIQAMLDKGAPYSYRFKLPENEIIRWRDIVLGWQTYNTSGPQGLGGDFNLMRSNGIPLYNLAVVVDDNRMGITHVLRASEHYINTPKQILIYRALRVGVPQFGHMPLVISSDGKKLSKRHGAVSVQQYQKMGAVPEALNNYLAQLGYALSEPILNLTGLTDDFDMSRMRKKEQLFTEKALRKINEEHLMRYSEEDAMKVIGGEMVARGIVKEPTGEFVRRCSIIVKERVQMLTEVDALVRSMLGYSLKETLASDLAKEFIEDGGIAETAKCLMELKEDGTLARLDNDPMVVEEVAQRCKESRGKKGKKLMMPLRICLTGVGQGPDLSFVYGILNVTDDNVIADVVPLSDRMAILEEEVAKLS